MDARIKKIEFVNTKNRKIKVKMKSGNTITITECYGGYQQYGGCTDELWTTVPIAEKYSDWLNGYDEFN